MEKQTLRRLLILTALALYVLIVVSGLVRITGSEIGCPGWPLCQGGIIPTQAGAWLELFHRLLTLVVGTLIIIVAQVSWKQRHTETDPWVWRPPLFAAVLLAVQALMGTITLWVGMPWLFVVLTVGIQTILLACMLIPIVSLSVENLGSLKPEKQTHPIKPKELEQARTYRLLVMSTAFLSWLLILVGGTVAGTSSGIACTGFPDCNGEIIPTTGGLPVFIHMTHRTIAYIVILLMLGVFVYTSVKRWRDYVLLQWVLLSGAMLMTQATIGGANSLLAMPISLRALHLAMATAYWGTIVIFGMLVLRRPVLSGLDPSGRIMKKGSTQPPTRGRGHSFADH